MKFLEKNHKYINDKDEVYTSVTSLIKMYEPHKDWDEIAAKYAKKNKKSVEEVKAAWKAEGDKAIAKGTAFHNKMEALYSEQPTWIVEDEECIVCPNPIVDGIKYAKDLKLDKGVYPELLIFSHKYKIAGQADLVEVVKDKINIKDYKTSKEIKKESHKHWKDGHEMMLYPLNNLMNSNFWHYSIQLNLYMYMLKAHNPKLKIGKMEIQHIQTQQDKIYGEFSKFPGEEGKDYNIDEWEKITVYPVPDLQKDVKRLLEHHSATLI